MHGRVRAEARMSEWYMRKGVGQSLPDWRRMALNNAFDVGYVTFSCKVFVHPDWFEYIKQWHVMYIALIDLIIIVAMWCHFIS